MLCNMLTKYRYIVVQTWEMTKYSIIHPCNKQIPSCNIIFSNKVELHFVRNEFVYSIQVNMLFDIFALTSCQNMCFFVQYKDFISILYAWLFPPVTEKNHSCNTHFITETYVYQVCMRKLFK